MFSIECIGTLEMWAKVSAPAVGESLEARVPSWELDLLAYTFTPDEMSATAFRGQNIPVLSQISVKRRLE